MGRRATKSTKKNKPSLFEKLIKNHPKVINNNILTPEQKLLEICVKQINENITSSWENFFQNKKFASFDCSFDGNCTWETIYPTIVDYSEKLSPRALNYYLRNLARYFIKHKNFALAEEIMQLAVSYSHCERFKNSGLEQLMTIELAVHSSRSLLTKTYQYTLEYIDIAAKCVQDFSVDLQSSLHSAFKIEALISFLYIFTYHANINPTQALTDEQSLIIGQYLIENISEIATKREKSKDEVWDYNSALCHILILAINNNTTHPKFNDFIIDAVKKICDYKEIIGQQKELAPFLNVSFKFFNQILAKKQLALWVSHLFNGSILPPKIKENIVGLKILVEQVTATKTNFTQIKNLKKKFDEYIELFEEGKKLYSTIIYLNKAKHGENYDNYSAPSEGVIEIVRECSELLDTKLQPFLPKPAPKITDTCTFLAQPRARASITSRQKTKANLPKKNPQPLLSQPKQIEELKKELPSELSFEQYLAKFADFFISYQRINSIITLAVATRANSKAKDLFIDAHEQNQLLQSKNSFLQVAIHLNSAEIAIALVKKALQQLKTDLADFKQWMNIKNNFLSQLKDTLSLLTAWKLQHGTAKTQPCSINDIIEAISFYHDQLRLLENDNATFIQSLEPHNQIEKSVSTSKKEKAQLTETTFQNSESNNNKAPISSNEEPLKPENPKTWQNIPTLVVFNSNSSDFPALTRKTEPSLPIVEVNKSRNKKKKTEANILSAQTVSDKPAAIFASTNLNNKKPLSRKEQEIYKRAFYDGMEYLNRSYCDQVLLTFLNTIIHDFVGGCWPFQFIQVGNQITVNIYNNVNTKDNPPPGCHLQLHFAVTVNNIPQDNPHPQFITYECESPFIKTYFEQMKLSALRYFEYLEYASPAEENNTSFTL